MGVLLEGFFFGPGRVAGVPSPLDGDHTLPFWWDHLASQARQLANSGFTAIWLPPPLKGASGSFSSGYDLFDDYDPGSKNQKGTIPTRYGSREALQRCAAVMRANRIDVYVDLVENQRDRDDGHFNFAYVTALSLSNRPLLTTTISYLSSRAKPRDLQFYGPFLEMFIGWSGEFCEVSSSDSAPSSAVSCVNL
jgi:hypothetical protein